MKGAEKEEDQIGDGLIPERKPQGQVCKSSMWLSMAVEDRTFWILLICGVVIPYVGGDLDDNIKKNEKTKRNIRKRNKMTAHFDIYATLRHTLQSVYDIGRPIEVSSSPQLRTFHDCMLNFGSQRGMSG